MDMRVWIYAGFDGGEVCNAGSYGREGHLGYIPGCKMRDRARSLPVAPVRAVFRGIDEIGAYDEEWLSVDVSTAMEILWT